MNLFSISNFPKAKSGMRWAQQAAVRAASIRRLAQWDKTKQDIGQDVPRIISPNASLDTLTAAIGAASIASLNSDVLKREFVKLLENPGTDADVRSFVVWQMDRFLLNPSEYAVYKRVILKLQKMPALQEGGAQ